MKQILIISIFCLLNVSTTKSSDVLKEIEANMVFVKGGTFTMGCTSEQESDCAVDEKPAFRAAVSDFYMGKYEVTQKQWQEIMGKNPSRFQGCDDCPVENVNWPDIQEFITKLNQKTGKNYRLPTEAEWEYAARGGNKSQGYKYAGSNDINAVAWHHDNSNSKTHPVGQKLPNELGLYDMTGNVWEWCDDWYDAYPAGDSNKVYNNPRGSSSDTFRGSRGGAWSIYAKFCRVSIRNYFSYGNKGDDLGFRLCYTSGK